MVDTPIDVKIIELATKNLQWNGKLKNISNFFGYLKFIKNIDVL